MLFFSPPLPFHLISDLLNWTVENTRSTPRVLTAQYHFSEIANFLKIEISSLPRSYIDNLSSTTSYANFQNKFLKSVMFVNNSSVKIL